MRTVLFAAATMAAALAACAADLDPLGGPYGGSGHAPTPSDKLPPVPPIDASCGSSASPARTTSVAEAGDDGGAPEGGDDAAGGAAPTWTELYTNYLTGCAAPGCHAETSTAKGAYSWLHGQGYISGATSTLVIKGKSCLKWFGGDMPPGCGAGEQAVSDMNAWVAAGASNN
jgi:hypothetical protein